MAALTTSPARLVLRRAISGAATVVVVTAVVFALAKASPFDPVATYLGANNEWASGETRRLLAERLGVDAPWWQHYGLWVSGLVDGDLGWSVAYRVPVADVLTTRMVWSLLLGAVSLAVAAGAAVVVAAAAARRPGRLLDRLIVSLTAVLAGTPAFLISLLLIGVFAVGWQLLPAGGLTDAGEPLGAGQVLTHLLLPAAALSTSMLPWLVLHLRESLVTTYSSPAVAGARLRGVPERQVLTGHVLPLSVMPAVTVLAARVPELITGTVLVEAVFGWPGLGQAMVRAATAVDYPLLAVVTAAAGLVVVTANLAADLLQWRLDSRTRGAMS